MADSECRALFVSSDQHLHKVLSILPQTRIEKIIVMDSLEFNGDLAPFAAGCHIDLHLPNGMIRSYSLLNDQSERNRYVVAVNKDAASRGGSSFIHETVRVGDIINISHPKNNFVLQEDAAHSVLIAGGIGITPLLSMIRRLETLGRSWELFYAARTRVAAAFLDELNSLRPCIHSNLHVNFDQEPPGRMLDLPAIVKDAPSSAHLYCCGSKLRRPIGRVTKFMWNISRRRKSRRPRAASR